MGCALNFPNSRLNPWFQLITKCRLIIFFFMIYSLFTIETVILLLVSVINIINGKNVSGKVPLYLEELSLSIQL